MKFEIGQTVVCKKECTVQYGKGYRIGVGESCIVNGREYTGSNEVIWFTDTPEGVGSYLAENFMTVEEFVAMKTENYQIY